MKKLDWKALGQFLSVVVSVFAIVRDALKKMNIGIEIIPWLADEGKEVFTTLWKQAGEKYLEAQNVVVEQVKKIVYAISVDYDMRVEEAVRLGGYNWSNDDITTKHFPVNRSGKADLEIELFHFNRSISSEAAIKEMDEKGYRPAELHELLALGAKYPDLQREFPIIALGSVWRDLSGDRCVACLNGSGSRRKLDLYDFGDGWGGNCRFAAVRK